MDDENIITITGEDGKDEKVELITELESVEGSHYIVYTKNELDEEENVIIYTSKVIEENGEPTLADLTEQEWEDIQKYLNEISEEE